MTALEPYSTRRDWFVKDVDDLVTTHHGSRLAIRPVIVEVVTWHNPGEGADRLMVVVRGPQVRVDGRSTSRDRIVTYWPVHDGYGRPLDDAPDWLRTLVAEVTS